MRVGGTLTLSREPTDSTIFLPVKGKVAIGWGRKEEEAAKNLFQGGREAAGGRTTPGAGGSKPPAQAALDFTAKTEIQR